MRIEDIREGVDERGVPVGHRIVTDHEGQLEGAGATGVGHWGEVGDGRGGDGRAIEGFDGFTPPSEKALVGAERRRPFGADELSDGVIEGSTALAPPD